MIAARALRLLGACSAIASPLIPACLVAQPLAAPAPSAQVAPQFDALHFRSIGPATMSGRVSSLAVLDANPSVYYVGTAHGGLWKTESNGNLFTPLLQHEGLMSIGAVSVSQSNPDLVWVGTGEANNRQSTSWGEGVYKSTDGGDTFTHMGLRDSRVVGQIVIDPADNDVVFVAATGSLFGEGGERGVYRSTNGGEAWTRVLHVDDETGATDLVMSPLDSKVLFAAMYQRRRSTCCMNGGGPGSGLHVSRDGGDSWQKVGGGFPEGPLGRIAVSIARSNPQVVYALVQAELAPGGGNTGLWRSNDGGLTWEKVNSVNPRPMYFSNLTIDPTNPERVYYGGVGLHVSYDGGKTVETDAARVVHDDVHPIWVDPRNPDHVLIGNDGGLAVSYDSNRTWQFVPNLPVGLFYHVSYDMETPFNVCGGLQDNYNWCGPSRSRQRTGIMNYDFFQILGGDGFVAIPDPRDSRIVYTESQNGNMLRRNIVTGESRRIRPTPSNVSPAVPDSEQFRFHWDAPMMLSPNDPGVLLVAANRVFRSTDRGDSWEVISPDLTMNGDRDTIVTMGLEGSKIKLARHDGISAWPAIVALGESPKQAGVIYTGTDDGTVSMTRDGGATWTNITDRLPGFPKGAFVSEVVPSRFEVGTVYVTVDNHREDDLTPHAWVSRDFGARFERITTGLDGEVVRTLTEDTRNPDVLYVGTETGLFLTLDRGQRWQRLGANFPTVRVDEITIHPRDNALLVATHGRSLWVLDDLAPIQEYAAATKASTATLFSIAPALQWKYKDDRNDEFWGHQTFIGENPPEAATMSVYVPTQPDSLALHVFRGAEQLRRITIDVDSGFTGIQTVCWDLRVAPITGGPPAPAGRRRGGDDRTPAIEGLPTPLPTAGYRPTDPCTTSDGVGGDEGPYVTPGEYMVALMANGREVSRKDMRVVMDPKVELTGAARVAYDQLLNDLHTRHQRGATMASQLTDLATQIAVVQSRIDSAPALPADARSRFTTLRARFDSVRVKFGVAQGRVPRPARAGEDSSTAAAPPVRFGGGGNNADNALAQLSSIKGLIGGIWETPSAASTQEAQAASQALDAAMAEASALLEEARTLGGTLAQFNRTLGVP